MRFVLLTLTCLIIVCGTASAQTLTLDDCIELALQNRASVIAARGAEITAKADQRAALGAFLPRVSASYDYGKSKSLDTKSEELVATGYDTTTFEVTVDTLSFTGLEITPTGYGVVETEYEDQDSRSQSYGLSGSMDLFNVSSWYSYAAATADRHRAHLDVIASEQDLILSVKVAYYAYLAAADNVEVQADAVKRSQEQLKLIESKYELGSAAKSDVLKQRVQVGNDRIEMITAENAVKTSRAELAYTIGIDPTGNTEFAVESTPRQYDGELEGAVSFALEHQPDLLALEQSSDVAKHSLSAARATYLPTLSARASMGWSGSAAGDSVTLKSSGRSTSYGLSASWTLFDGFNRERNVAQAKISRNNLRAQVSDQRNYVVLAVKTAYYDIEQARLQREVAGENVAAAEEDMRITEEKYRLGAAAILDLLDAQVTLKGAQVGLIQADYNLNLAVARLENAMGMM